MSKYPHQPESHQSRLLGSDPGLIKNHLHMMLLKVGLNWRVLKKSLKKKMKKEKKKRRREKMGRTWLVLEKNLSRKMLKMKYTCD